MVKKFLKIAGVKTEAEFYKKYPSEAAFFKAHPEAKELKQYKQGGQQKKLNQLTSYQGDIDNLIPMAQDGMTSRSLSDNSDIGYYTGGDVDDVRNIESYDTYRDQLTMMRQAEKAQKDAQMDQLQSTFQNIGKKAKKGTKIPKLQNANTQGLGLNSPAGGVMTLAPQAAQANANTQSMLWGTGGSVTQAPVLGGVTPSSIAGMNKTPGFDLMGALGGAQGIGNLAGSVIGGIKNIKNAKEATKDAEAMAKISELSLQAAKSRPEETRRRYIRPEDALIQPEQLFPSYGVGTNYLARNGSVLRAQTGMQIGGNLTEIQNMYNPGDMYQDLGYEPLNESDEVKQYQGGGMLGILGGGSATTPGVGGMTGADMGSIGTGVFNAAFGASPESQLGGQIGSVFGPVGSIAGTMIGKIAGSKREARMANAQQKTKYNTEQLMGQAFGQGIQGQFGNYMKDGGWVSHDWQPQVITKFGEYDVKDLLRKDPTMDTLRTGGRITQNNMYPQDQYALGGELKTTWGGHAESMSHNPYLPGTGETVMFRGKSHEESDGNGHTGIGVKYGNNHHDSYTDYAEFGTEQADADVEVERGEPAMEMMDESGDKNMVVFGNLKIPTQFLDQIGDPSAKGKKFKSYVASLSKKEAKQNKIIDNATRQLDNLDVYTPFDQLKLQGLKAMLTGADMKLQDIAQKKMNASSVQNAINETAEEMGVDADSLAKGKIKVDKKAQQEMAKFGKEILKAQTGYKEYQERMRTSKNLPINWNMQSVIPSGNIFNSVPSTAPVASKSSSSKKSSKSSAKTSNRSTAAATTTAPATTSTAVTSSTKLPALKQEDYEYLKGLYDEAKKHEGKGKHPAVLKFQKEYHRLAPDFAKAVIQSEPLTEYGKEKKLTTSDLSSNEDSLFGKRTVQYMARLENAPKFKGKITPSTPVEDPVVGTYDEITPDVEPLKDSSFINIANQILPYLRPSDQEEFDYAQIYPEMMALASNQVEPVQAQTYQPQLLTPYDVSYQDQLNEVAAQTRAAERLVGNNPAAVAAIAADANRAKSSILGEQFRQNQAQRMGVYNQNIGAINDAKLRNLGILDQQMVRQQEAKSKTKAQNLEAVKSISDKIAKNKLENKTLGIYENLYNYRFDPTGRAINMNPLAQFNVARGGSGSSARGGLASGYEFTYDANGQIIGTRKSPKKDEDETTGRNGRIVKAMKGL